MKWTYAIRHKLVAALVLTAVIGLVVLNNFNEKRNSDQIHTAISAIYQDRLMADHYIIQYLQHSHHLVEALEDESLSETTRKTRVFAILSQVKTLNRAYLKTRLTPAETASFQKLSNQYLALQDAIRRQDLVDAKAHARTSIQTLAGLSDIQFQEARLQMTAIDKLKGASAVFFRFEVGILIVVCLIVQALIFASRSMQVPMPGRQSSLN